MPVAIAGKMILIVFIVGMLVAAFPSAWAATTELTVTKYANDGTTVLSQTTKNYTWLQANLPVKGDGVTHYFHQGPTIHSRSQNIRYLIPSQPVAASRRIGCQE